MKKYFIFTPVLAALWLVSPAGANDKQTPTKTSPLLLTGNEDRKMRSLIFAKQFCVALRRNHQADRSAALVSYLSPDYLSRHKINEDNFNVTTFPLFNIYNIEISEDPDTILCLVDSRDGRRDALLLRTTEIKGKLFLDPVTPPHPESGTFTPWILRTEIKSPPAGAQEKRALEKRTISGVLKHHPQDVKNVEAWLGHEFTVDGTSIIPTKAVSKATLMKHIGEQVTINGIWNPGKEWKPLDGRELLSNPLAGPDEKILRGSGIEAQGLTLPNSGQ